MEREAEKEAYLNGLLHMASACSDWIGCSQVTAFLCGDDPAAALAADCGAKAEQLRLIPAGETAKQTFARWFGGKNAALVNDLLWLITSALGEAAQVYRLEDEETRIGRFGWGEGGNGPYYFSEDVCVIAFRQATVCFYLGNNE